MNNKSVLHIPHININPSVGWDIGPNYTFISLLGCGSYGTVCEALCLRTHKQVAIKRFQNIFSDSKRCIKVLREIELLYSINCIHIVRPLDVFIREGFDIYLVMELAQVDLTKLKQAVFLVERQVKVIMYRLLLALNYIHSAGIIHRDIKPANILVNGNCTIKLCDFSLGRSITSLTSSCFDCGFVFSVHPAWNSSVYLNSSEEDMWGEIDEGNKEVSKTNHYKFEVAFHNLGRHHEEKKGSNKVALLEAKKKEQRNILLYTSKAYNPVHARELSGHVATRWYRPPEIILLEKFYNTAIDIWGAGCVFYELIEMIKENQPDVTKRSVLFPGKSCFPLSPSDKPTDKILGMPTSPRDQLKLILNVYGEPSAADLSFLNDQRAEDYVKALSRTKSKLDFREKLPGASDRALDLLSKLLAFNPYYRITAKEALRHPYFDEIRNKLQEDAMSWPILLLVDTLNKDNLQLLTSKVLQKVMGKPITI